MAPNAANQGRTSDLKWKQVLQERNQLQTSPAFALLAGDLERKGNIFLVFIASALSLTNNSKFVIWVVPTPADEAKQ